MAAIDAVSGNGVRGVNTDKIDLEKYRERYTERQSTNAHLASNSIFVAAQQTQC